MMNEKPCCIYFIFILYIISDYCFIVIYIYKPSSGHVNFLKKINLIGSTVFTFLGYIYIYIRDDVFNLEKGSEPMRFIAS